MSFQIGMVYKRLANMLIKPIGILLFLLSPALLMNPQWAGEGDQAGGRPAERQAATREIEKEVKDMWMRIAAMEKAWLYNERKHATELQASADKLRQEGEMCTSKEKSLREQKAQAEVQYNKAQNHGGKDVFRAKLKALRRQLAHLLMECEEFFSKQKQWMEQQNKVLELMLKEIEDLETSMNKLRERYRSLTGEKMPVSAATKRSPRQPVERTQKLTLREVQRRQQRYQPSQIQQRQEQGGRRRRGNRTP